MKGMLAVLGLSLFCAAWAVPAVAKCTKACRQELAAQLRGCTNNCTKGTAGKDCRGACNRGTRAARLICKKTQHPVPPTCAPCVKAGEPCQSVIPTLGSLSVCCAGLACIGPACAACRVEGEPCDIAPYVSECCEGLDCVANGSGTSCAQ